MGEKKTSELTLDASPALTDRFVVVTDPLTTPVSGLATVASVKTLLNVDTQRIWKTIADPQALYTLRAQIPLFRAPANLTFTRIHLVLNDNTPTAEFAGDLKFADDQFDGVFANATVIDVLDTTSGAFTATSSFDDATVPSGKYVYLQMDASPHVDIDNIYIEVYWTYD